MKLAISFCLELPSKSIITFEKICGSQIELLSDIKVTSGIKFQSNLCIHTEKLPSDMEIQALNFYLQG